MSIVLCDGYRPEPVHDIRGTALLVYLQFLSDRHNRYLREGWPDAGYEAGIDEIRHYVIELVEPEPPQRDPADYMDTLTLEQRRMRAAPEHSEEGWSR